MKKTKNKAKIHNQNQLRIILNKITFLILTVFLAIGCSNEKEETNDSNNLNTENKVSKETINLIAQNFFKNNDVTGKGGKQLRTIKNSKEYLTSKKASAFYVVNYNEGGFIILAADDRVSPVLAFSDTGSFNTTDKEIIPPVAYWMESQKTQIQATISSNKSQSNEKEQEWKGVIKNSLIKSQKTNSTSKIIEPDPQDCPESTFTTVGPYVTAKWGQGDGYNNLINYDCGFGTKAVTGCVATAMAQVMRYFQRPTSYNWANMPNTTGTSDTQLLMKNIGTAVSMNYGCSESGAYGTSMAPALLNTFGYYAASYGGFNLNTVITNLNTNKPVILTGANSTNTSAHAWVCDGYNQYTSYIKDDRGYCIGAVTYQPSLHMNWGWNGSYNGYYTVGSFNPGSSNYNNGVKMLYNIW